MKDKVITHVHELVPMKRYCDYYKSSFVGSGLILEVGENLILYI